MYVKLAYQHKAKPEKKIVIYTCSDPCIRLVKIIPYHD